MPSIGSVSTNPDSAPYVQLLQRSVWMTLTLDLLRTAMADGVAAIQARLELEPLRRSERRRAGA